MVKKGNEKMQNEENFFLIHLIRDKKLINKNKNWLINNKVN